MCLTGNCYHLRASIPPPTLPPSHAERSTTTGGHIKHIPSARAHAHAYFIYMCTWTAVRVAGAACAVKRHTPRVHFAAAAPPTDCVSLSRARARAHHFYHFRACAQNTYRPPDRHHRVGKERATTHSARETGHLIKFQITNVKCKTMSLPPGTFRNERIRQHRRGRAGFATIRTVGPPPPPPTQSHAENNAATQAAVVCAPSAGQANITLLFSHSLRRYYMRAVWYSIRRSKREAIVCCCGCCFALPHAGGLRGPPALRQLTSSTQQPVKTHALCRPKQETQIRKSGKKEVV